MDDHASTNFSTPELISPSRAAATLRSLVDGLGVERPVVVIGSEGVPQAALVSYDAYLHLVAAAEEADARMLSDRVAGSPAPGEGLTNSALEELVSGRGGITPNAADGAGGLESDDGRGAVGRGA
ncbi:hypothetical protein AB0D08_06790 [Kitasatospora sp. NPDC048540]|uniref:hypothetical protein n=1 Tax=Kitasatospora sp. NPDC048540 TaxID=3155634 RepID=UPI0033D69096